MIRISVIIPVYNVEPYLHRCVDSILSQTFTDFELILVDDGSPDNCPAICDEYAAKDSRVRAIHKENGGLSSARNAGLDVATGEYVLFVDSDDWIEPETLEKTLDTARRTGSDMVIFDYTDVYEDGTAPLRMPNDFAHEEEWTHDDFWQYYYSGYSVIGVVAWNKLCKRSLFLSLRYPIGKIHEDEFVIFDLVKQAQRIFFLNEPFYFYLRRADSIMGTRNHWAEMDRLEAFVKRAVNFSRLGDTTNAQRTIQLCISQYVDKRHNPQWTKQEKKRLVHEMKKISKLHICKIWDKWNRLYKMTILAYMVHPDLFPYLSKIRQIICPWKYHRGE